MPQKPHAIEPLRIADAGQHLRHVFVRDLVIDASIGIYEHEKASKQRIRVNLDLGVREQARIRDAIDDVVCYEAIVNKVKAVVDDGHTNLVETLVERVAAICLQDPRVRSARVRIEKLDVFEDVGSVGVEIERHSGLA